MLNKFKHLVKKPVANNRTLQDILGQTEYQNMLAEARKRISTSGTKLHKLLNNDDIVAIYLYTHQELKHYHYKSINSVLRGKYHPLAGDILTIANTLDAALAKLPAFNGYTARAVNFDFWLRRQHRPGKVVTYDAFTSSTKLHNPPFECNTHKMIVCKSGRDISWISRFPDEQEVLYPRGTKFKVLSVVRNGPMMEIVMEEV